MFKSIHAAILLLMTLGVSAPIIYAETQNNNNRQYYIVGHGTIIPQGRNLLGGPSPNNGPCDPQKCTAPKAADLG